MCSKFVFLQITNHNMHSAKLTRTSWSQLEEYLLRQSSMSRKNITNYCQYKTYTVFRHITGATAACSVEWIRRKDKLFLLVKVWKLHIIYSSNKIRGWLFDEITRQRDKKWRDNETKIDETTRQKWTRQRDISKIFNSALRLKYYFTIFCSLWTFTEILACNSDGLQVMITWVRVDKVSERSERSAMPSNRQLIYRLARSARRLCGCMGSIWNMPASKFTSRQCFSVAGKLFLPRFDFLIFHWPNRVFGAICIFSTYSHYSKVEFCSSTSFWDDFGGRRFDPMTLWPYGSNPMTLWAYGSDPMTLWWAHFNPMTQWWRFFDAMTLCNFGITPYWKSHSIIIFFIFLKLFFQLLSYGDIFVKIFGWFLPLASEASGRPCPPIDNWFTVLREALDDCMSVRDWYEICDGTY